MATGDLIEQVATVTEELQELEKIKARQEGKKETTMASLKRVFHVETIEHAETLRDQKIKKRNTLTENITVIKDKLQKVIDENKANLDE